MISIRPTLTILIIIIVTTMIIIQKPSRPKKQNARSLGPVMIIVSPRAHYLPCPHRHPYPYWIIVLILNLSIILPIISTMMIITLTYK